MAWSSSFFVKKELQTRYLSQAVQLEEGVNPHIIRATTSMISAVILAFLVWAGLTTIHEVARAAGEVVPLGHQQIVQHLEGGIIKHIHVREGKSVQKGDALITLDSSGLIEDAKRYEARLNSLALQEERLRAYIDNREPESDGFQTLNERQLSDHLAFFDGMRAARESEAGIIEDQLKQKQQALEGLLSDMRIAQENLSLARDVFKRRKALEEKGYASTIQILESQQRMNSLSGDIQRIKSQVAAATTEISQFEKRLLSLYANHRDKAYEKLSAIESEMSQIREMVTKLRAQLTRLELRAPISGIVKGLNKNTIGSVIQPAETIMEIVPASLAMEVVVRISPQDIGHTKVGQSVQIKLSSYDFSRYGFVKGTLKQISATTFSGEHGERYYEGKIALDKPYVGDNPSHRIMPGMTVMADVITGEKTILQYLFKPIHLSLQTAFSER